LFKSIRSAASCCHPWHEIAVPRGARNGPLVNPAFAAVPGTVTVINFNLRRSY